MRPARNRYSCTSEENRLSTHFQCVALGFWEVLERKNMFRPISRGSYQTKEQALHEQLPRFLSVLGQPLVCPVSLTLFFVPLFLKGVVFGPLALMEST